MQSKKANLHKASIARVNKVYNQCNFFNNQPSHGVVRKIVTYLLSFKTETYLLYTWRKKKAIYYSRRDTKHDI